VAGRPDEDGNILNAVQAARPDAIVHFAANALVGESMTNPGKYFHNNVVNALKLADAAVECGVKKFVFSSTCATYGPPDRVPMTEDLPQRPINPYGESKLMFEKVLIWYQQIYKLDFIAFRYFNAAGASEKFGEHHRIETHLIPNVLKVALGQAAQCEIYGTDYPTPDGTCIRDYIHVADIADAHVAALRWLTEGSSSYQVLNIGRGEGASVRDVMATVAQVTGIAFEPKVVERRAGDPARIVAQVDRIRDTLGWTARFDLTDMVASAWSAWTARYGEPG